MEMLRLSSLLQRTVKFSIGLQNKEKCRIIPIFFPFSGCETRCIFCAQQLQSGVREVHDSDIPRYVHNAVAGLPPRESVEIAFYGGTFTLWPRVLQKICLETLYSLSGNESSWKIRCSTRPAAFASRKENPLDPEWLRSLYDMGLECIELGVQSFHDDALRSAKRGYTGAAALEGCHLVRRTGMRLGVQLMPGMPGVTPEVFLSDVATALEAGAGFLRFYPCLVMEGTELAHVWRSGRYTPWNLETTIQTLAKALLLCWEAHTPVIRMGLAPGETLYEGMLAGPWHPALGSLVQAEALGLLVERLARGRTVRSLRLPSWCKGFIGDKRAELRQRWMRLGISTDAVLWHDGTEGLLEYEEPLTSDSPEIGSATTC